MTSETKASVNRFLWQWLIGPEVQWEGSEPTINLFNPGGFFLVWNRAKEHKDWDRFLNYNYIIHNDLHSGEKVFTRFINTDKIDPLVFLPEWARFIGWKE